MRKLIRFAIGSACSGLLISLLMGGVTRKLYASAEAGIWAEGWPAVPAQTLRVLDHRMTAGPVSASDCVAPDAKYNFTPSDARAYHWVRLAGIRARDVIRWDFFRPDGALYDSFPFTFSNSTDGCISAYISLAGQPAAALSGAWQVLVSYNSVPIVIERFTISGANLASSVSAASYQPGSAPEAMVAAFGSSFATTTAAATTLPLPTKLAGVTVTIRDSKGTELAAPLFFASPTQVNYLVPSGTRSGTALVTVTRSSGTVATGILEIAEVAPSLFAANATGQGLAAAVILRRREGGQETYEPVAVFDASQNRLVPQPIDLGPETDQVFLLLFGTGFRQRSVLSAVTCRIGGTDAAVSYAGPQNDFVGLDQANVRLPRSLAGKGEVEVALSVDGEAANTVRVQIK